MSELTNSEPAREPGSGHTIRLSERDAQEVRRLLRLLTTTNSTQSLWAQPTRASGPFHSDALLEIARVVVASRQSRKAYFASSIFGEPAWDMLLTLYVADREGMPVTVGRLAQLSDARLTTAIRWIEYLEQSGLIERRDHPHDARVVLIELTEQAIDKLETYFRDLLEVGLIP